MKMFSMEEIPLVKGNFLPEYGKFVFIWVTESSGSVLVTFRMDELWEFPLILFPWKLLSVCGKRKSSQLEVDHYQIIVWKSKTHQPQGQVHPHVRRLPRSHSCHCSQSSTKRKCLQKKKKMTVSHKPTRSSEDTFGPSFPKVGKSWHSKWDVEGHEDDHCCPSERLTVPEHLQSFTQPPVPAPWGPFSNNEHSRGLGLTFMASKIVCPKQKVRCC